MVWGETEGSGERGRRVWGTVALSVILCDEVPKAMSWMYGTPLRSFWFTCCSRLVDLPANQLESKDIGYPFHVIGQLINFCVWPCERRLSYGTGMLLVVDYLSGTRVKGKILGQARRGGITRINSHLTFMVL